MTENLEQLRAEAEALPEDAWMMRSCWECNPAHKHLRNVDDAVLSCFACGHFFFKGVDVTIFEDAGSNE